MDCIFCKIVAGEIPSVSVFEDEATLAFMDINPVTEGHLLVIPKRHCVGMFDAPEEELAATIRAVRKVALGLQEALEVDSLSVVQATGKWATQHVPHLHFHLIPRSEDDGVPIDWELRPGDVEAIEELGGRIAAAVR